MTLSLDPEQHFIDPVLRMTDVGRNNKLQRNLS